MPGLKAPATPEEGACQWREFVSAFYPPVVDTDSVTLKQLQELPALSEPPPTTSKLSANELGSMFEPQVLFHSRGLRIRQMAVEVIRRNFRRAFLDGSTILPKVDVVVICGTQTVWACHWANKAIKDLSHEPAIGDRKRCVSFVAIPGGNHFVSFAHSYLCE